MIEAIQLALLRICLLVVAASLAALALQSELAREAFAQLLSLWRGMTAWGRTIFLSLLIVCCVYGSTKTNSPPLMMIRPLPVLPTVGQSVSETEIAKGYRQVSDATNENVSYAMPSNALIAGNWHKRGTFGEWMRLDFGNFAFPLGTNDTAYSAFSVFNDGKIRPTPRDTAHEICAVGVPMLAVQGVSRFWTAGRADGSMLLTWKQFFLNGDTNVPVNAQIRLFPNGDFLTRSNGVETVYARVNPDDWDGDGIANVKDANPTEWDGDFFGTANALPANANANAYYWLDLSVTGVLGVATIRVTCDGPSDLGDHVIIARTNDVCHVPLLAGATYAVESGLPITLSSVSSEYASIVTNSETSLTVSLPLEFSFESVQMRGGPAGYAVQTSPIDVMPRLMSVSGGCCSCTTNGTGFSWSSMPTCTCGGSAHQLDATATWEGYVKQFYASASCGCGTDDPDPQPEPQTGPYVASVSVSFSSDAVIFENAYENMPGEWMPRRSTATTLTIHADGGPNGGMLTVAATNLGKLQKNSGPAFPAQSVIVPAGHSVTYEMNYVGLAASDATNDIVVVATLTDNITEEAVSNACSLTSVRLELAAIYEAPENPCTNRHVYGVGEKVRFLHYPETVQVSFTAAKGDTSDIFTYYDQFGGSINDADKHRIYVCPIASSYTPNPTVSCSGTSYTPLLTLVEPQEVITPEVSWEGCHAFGEVGQSTLITTNYIGPMTVSFQGIMIAEIPCYETNAPSGYFATTDFTGFMTHSAEAEAGHAWRVQERNRWAVDRAGGGLYRNWSAGLLVWNIPIGWGRLPSDDYAFRQLLSPEYEGCTNNTTRPLLIGGKTDLYKQTFRIDETGTARVDKFGHWLSRSSHCRIILDGNTVQRTHPLW